jgi:hypothetical protein
VRIAFTCRIGLFDTDQGGGVPASPCSVSGGPQGLGCGANSLNTVAPSGPGWEFESAMDRFWAASPVMAKAVAGLHAMIRRAR